MKDMITTSEMLGHFIIDIYVVVVDKNRMHCNSWKHTFDCKLYKDNILNAQDEKRAIIFS